ncbi:hypothetical protein BDZ89DRAFT_1110139 [Hymenopellis radicata]|nr:hypothetical protein BDZ89DRAFT_1110139 [Hymenopellis radicata]
MYSLYSEPEHTLSVDIIDETEFYQSGSSKLFDDLNSPWAPLTMSDIVEDSEYSPVIAAPRPSPLLSFGLLDYPSSPYFVASPLSDTPSLCSTPSPTINPMDLMASSPCSSYSSDWNPCVKAESPPPSLPLLPLLEVPDDILSLTNLQINKRDYDDLMELDDDEAVLEALGRKSPVRRAKLLHDDEDNDQDETFVPEEDERPVKRQRLSRSASPRSSASPKPRRSKLSSPYASMHHCPFAKCYFHSERHSDVDRHVKSVHEKIRFACPVCDKQLTRRDAVKRHQEAGDACNKALRKKARLLAKMH